MRLVKTTTNSGLNINCKAKNSTLSSCFCPNPLWLFPTNAFSSCCFRWWIFSFFLLPVGRLTRISEFSFVSLLLSVKIEKNNNKMQPISQISSWLVVVLLSLCSTSIHSFRYSRSHSSRHIIRVSSTSPSSTDPILRRIDKWACVKGCGACCKLGPLESRPDLASYLTTTELDLYKSMIGEDDWYAIAFTNISLFSNTDTVIRSLTHIIWPSPHSNWVCKFSLT